MRHSELKMQTQERCVAAAALLQDTEGFDGGGERAVTPRGLTCEGPISDLTLWLLRLRMQYPGIVSLSDESLQHGDDQDGVVQ